MPSLADIIIGGILVVVVGLILAKLHSNKKQGKTSCGCNCSGCATGGCSVSTQAIQEKLKESQKDKED